MPQSVRSYFEPRFNRDFSQVRIHTDTTAAESAKELNANAYTIGSSIVFGKGQYAPATLEGKQLLSHELTHVTQQGPLIHRQQSPTLSTPSRSEWDKLPLEAQEVLDYSFITRRPDEWIWRGGRSAADCYNSRSFDEIRPAFCYVYRALNQQGIWLWVERISNVWTRKAQGFSFRPDNRADLVERLSASGGFCRDDWLGAGFSSTPKWRQIVPTATPGLHLIIPNSGECTAHIDMLAPVEGREPSGKCNYHLSTGVRHWWKEEKHWWDK